MKHLGVCILMAAAMVIPSLASAQLVIVVRHAERADGGAGATAGMTAPADPKLSDAGKARAQKLASMFADAGVTAIYATEFRRTRDTVGPLADKTGIAVEVVPARDATALMEKIKSHKTGTVVVVGHSNTVPAIVKALGGPSITMADDEYDSLYVVAANGATTRIRFSQ